MFYNSGFSVLPAGRCTVVTSFFDPLHHASVVMSVLSWAAGVEISTLVISTPTFLNDSQPVPFTIHPPTKSISLRLTLT